MDTKILVGIATNRGVKPQTVLSLLHLIHHSPFQFEFVMATEGFTTAENRTYLAVQAIKRNCTHLLFVDDDMTFPSEALVKLINHNKDIIGVNSHSRKLPLKTTVELFEGQTEMPKEVFTCKAVGFGVALIKTEVFNRIPRPWFSTEINELGMTTRGEDTWFCYKALEQGIRVWCDPTLEIGHWGEYKF